MVTGLAEAKSLEAAFDVGAADYINKPVNRVEVLARVRSALMLKQEVDVRKLAYIELEQESLAKSQILSTVTHELKTPLTSIVGYSDRLLLRQEQVGQLNDRQQKYVKAIRDSSRELTVLISDLLDVSRIEAGRIEIELTNLEVRHKIEDIVQNVQTQLEEKQINLVRDMPPDSCEAKVDENRFSQIFNNLLSNACKYSSVGATVTITVKQDPDFLQFDISDTGMGISAVDQSKLFTKYFRADNTATRDESGTGLGLFITKLLVEAHGGAIWVDSKEGIGSTFSFTLPRADIDVTQMEASVVSLG
jgi:signal transduction histidine kinase